MLRTAAIVALVGLATLAAVGASASAATDPPITHAIAASQEWSQPMDDKGSVIIDDNDALNGWSPFDAVGMFVTAESGADFCKAVGPVPPDAHFRVTCFNVQTDGTVEKAANTRVDFAWETVVYTADTTQKG